ncbi:MAG: glucokinase [Rhodobacteraceae bacterium]|nr:glucokinase [Paracoccaceae bacterium]
MTNDLTLVADVGGTNTRFALANSNGIIADSSIRYSNTEVDSFLEAAQSYVATLDGVKPTNLCAAIAGPVSGGKGKLTNGDWMFDTDVLAQSLGLKQAYLLNDLAALGYALDVLPDHVVTQIGGGKPHGDQALVAGIATGFNVSMCHEGHVIEAELGHASLPSSVMAVLQEAVGDKASSFHKVEALFSGDGLAALHIALGFKATDPAQITAPTSSEGAQTVALFAQALGMFCCELTYQYMPLAGLYFNGSVARAIVSSESAAKVIAAEASKDETFSGRFGQVPLFVITEDNAALYGCARYAQSRV